MEWDQVTDALEDWEEGLPKISAGELHNLLSTGESLPPLLEAAEDESREAIDALIRRRVQGEPWPELAATWKIFLMERFEWAHAVVATMEGCGVPRPAHFVPESLLLEGWDASGALHTHDDLLRRYLPELLRRATGGCYKDVGG